MGGGEKIVNYLYRGFERLIFNPANTILEGRIRETTNYIKLLGKAINKQTGRERKYFIGDLHIHSMFSDGVNTVDHIARVAKRKGLDIISITDHDTLEQWDYCKKAERKYDLMIIPGIELTVSHNGQEFHILGLFPSYENKAELERKLHRGMPFLEASKVIREKGGVVILAHPLVHNGISRENLEDLIQREKEEKVTYIDGIEEFNPSAGEAYRTLADEYKKTGLANSDSHQKISIGLALNIFSNKIEGKEDVLKAIRENHILKDLVVAKSGIERNIDKLRMLHPFYLEKTLVEYFDDKEKIIARKLTEILENEQRGEKIK